MELLKIEKLIVSCFTALSKLASEFQKKFVDIVSKCSTDFSDTLNFIQNSHDVFAIEMVTNFLDSFKLSIEEMARVNQVAEVQLPDGYADESAFVEF